MNPEKRKSLRRWYLFLREVVILLGLFEYVAFGLGALSIGAAQLENSLLWFALMGASYYISTKLGYRVTELLVKLYSTN